MLQIQIGGKLQLMGPLFHSEMYGLGRMDQAVRTRESDGAFVERKVDKIWIWRLSGKIDRLLPSYFPRPIWPQAHPYTNS